MLVSNDSLLSELRPNSFGEMKVLLTSIHVIHPTTCHDSLQLECYFVQ